MDDAFERVSWVRIYTAKYRAGYTGVCCACGSQCIPTYSVFSIPIEFRSTNSTGRLSTCLTKDDHGICTMCQSCGKKLGFEW